MLAIVPSSISRGPDGRRALGSQDPRASCLRARGALGGGTCQRGFPVQEKGAGKLDRCLGGVPYSPVLLLRWGLRRRGACSSCWDGLPGCLGFPSGWTACSAVARWWLYAAGAAPMRPGR